MTIAAEAVEEAIRTAHQLSLFEIPGHARRPRRAKAPEAERRAYGGAAKHVYTVVVSDNATLMAEAYRLHLHRCAVIADVTFGQGVFWRKIDLSPHTFLASDMVTCPDAPHDFRALPYVDACIDALILDPPYMHNPGRPMVEARYQNGATTRGMYHADIIELYRGGMAEAWRVLCPGGLALVKCQDEIESGRQCRSTIEVWFIARELGFEDLDKFTLVRPTPPHVQAKRQLHARRAESVLWIFRKPGRTRRALAEALELAVEHRATWTPPAEQEAPGARSPRRRPRTRRRPDGLQALDAQAAAVAPLHIAPSAPPDWMA